MSRAGYYPSALVAYLERSGAGYERVAALRESVRGLAAGGFASDDGRFAELQAAVRRVSRLGDKPVAPSLRNGRK